ncbi:hypothetical protein [Nonomuraea diastatica]|uniref:Uncharacterized protein n=1 Tax=Nonomuraea diastatica TaxID=1848329 RepID=A0A4R4X2A8_9ACTN|nr:hypothetical protein [Nonomuraea diastatica]TDD24332.1 hypothetical protein E1294_06220 [Nonomuraea diastatica]
MVRNLIGTFLAAAAATSLMAAPADATSSSAGAAAVAVTAKPHLIRGKIYFGRCGHTCQVKVRIRNVSRTNVVNVRLKARLKINGRHVGTCHDHVGTIRARKTRWASCTVRSRSLSRAYGRYLAGRSDFNRHVFTTTYYRYYR